MRRPAVILYRAWLGVLLFVGALNIADHAVACATLTPADKASIAKDQVELSLCASAAHAAKEEDAGAAKAWAVFDACMVRKGFYDGGADAR